MLFRNLYYNYQYNTCVYKTEGGDYHDKNHRRQKRKGKTKHLLDMVNTEVKNVHGNIVYLDKSGKHMYELNNKVRLIDMSEYDLKDTSEFIGFIYGSFPRTMIWSRSTWIASWKISNLEGCDVTDALGRVRYHR